MKITTKSKYSLKSALLRFSLMAAVLLTSVVIGRADDVSVDLTGGWQFTNGSEYPGADGKYAFNADTKSLDLTYNFEKGGQYVGVYRNLDPVAALSTIKLEVKGPGGGLTVALGDATGQTLLYRLGMIEDSSRSISLDLAHPSDSYGGAKDKVIHFPIKSIRLTIEKGPATSGKLTFTSLTLVPAPDPTPTPTPTP